MYVAPIGKCFRVDVCANRDIANTLNLFALPSHKSFSVFIRGGHILGIGEHSKGSAISKLILEQGNAYDIVHSDTSFESTTRVFSSFFQHNFWLAPLKSYLLRLNSKYHYAILYFYW
jgi:hypothetical protein